MKTSKFTIRKAALNTLVIACALFFALSNISSASQISLSINPQKFDIGLFPGENYRGEINISNRSEVTLPVSVQALTFTAAEDTGNMIFLADGELSESPGMWFSISQPDILLEAGERRKVEFEIEIPREARPRGYAAFILFEPRMPSHYFEESGARAVPAIGAPVLLTVQSLGLDEEPRDELEIVEFSLSESERVAFLERVLGSIESSVFLKAQASDLQATKGKPSAFNLRIRNNSDYHLQPQGTVIIRNVLGVVVGEVEIPKQTILPGKTRLFPAELYHEPNALLSLLPESISDFFIRNFFVGRYTANLRANSFYSFGVGGGDQVIVRDSLVVYSLPWVSLTFITLSLTVLVMIAFRFRRIKKALEVLLKGVSSK